MYGFFQSKFVGFSRSIYEDFVTWMFLRSFQGAIKQSKTTSNFSISKDVEKFSNFTTLTTLKQNTRVQFCSMIPFFGSKIEQSEREIPYFKIHSDMYVAFSGIIYRERIKICYLLSKINNNDNNNINNNKTVLCNKVLEKMHP